MNATLIVKLHIIPQTMIHPERNTTNSRSWIAGHSIFKFLAEPTSTIIYGRANARNSAPRPVSVVQVDQSYLLVAMTVVAVERSHTLHYVSNLDSPFLLWSISFMGDPIAL
jgi:hypothetical protein